MNTATAAEPTQTAHCPKCNLLIRVDQPGQTMTCPQCSHDFTPSALPAKPNPLESCANIFQAAGFTSLVIAFILAAIAIFNPSERYLFFYGAAALVTGAIFILILAQLIFIRLSLERHHLPG